MAQLPEPNAPQSATAAAAAALAAATTAPPGAGPAPAPASATLPAGASFAPGTGVAVGAAQYGLLAASMTPPQGRAPFPPGVSQPVPSAAGYPYGVAVGAGAMPVPSGYGMPPVGVGPRPAPLIDPWRFGGGGAGAGMSPMQQQRPLNNQFPLPAVGQHYPLPQQVPGVAGATYTTLQGIARSRPKPGGGGAAAGSAGPITSGGAPPTATAQAAQQQLPVSVSEPNLRPIVSESQQQDSTASAQPGSTSAKYETQPFENPDSWLESQNSENTQQNAQSVSGKTVGASGSGAQDEADLMGLQEPPRPSMLQRLLQSQPQSFVGVSYPISHQPVVAYPNVPPPFPFNTVSPMQQQLAASVPIRAVAVAPGFSNATVSKDPALQRQPKSRDPQPDDDLLIDPDSDGEHKTRVNAIIGMYEYGHQPLGAGGAGNAHQRFSSDGRVMNPRPLSVDTIGASRPPLPPPRPTSSPNYPVGLSNLQQTGGTGGAVVAASAEQQQRSHRRIVSDSSSVRPQLALSPSLADNALEAIPSQSPPKSARREASFTGGVGQSASLPQPQQQQQRPKEPPQLMARPGSRPAAPGVRPAGPSAECGANADSTAASDAFSSSIRPRTSSAAAAMRNPIPLDLTAQDRARFGGSGSLEHPELVARPAPPAPPAAFSKPAIRNSMGDDQFGIEFDRIRIGDAAVSRPLPANQFKSTSEDFFDSNSGDFANLQYKHINFCEINLISPKIN